MSSVSETKVVYLATPSTDRDDCKHLHKTYDKKGQLGKGAYGTVYELCKKASDDCPYVLKVITYNRADDEMIGVPKLTLKYIKDEWNTEVRIMHKLNQCQKNLGHQFVPLIFDAWYCTEKDFTYFYIVTERWTGNISDFIRKYKSNDAIKVAAVTNLNLLTILLKMIHRDCKICLNDIKMDNILFKQTGKYNYTFVFNDFGKATEDATIECQANDTKWWLDTVEKFTIALD